MMRVPSTEPLSSTIKASNSAAWWLIIGSMMSCSFFTIVRPMTRDRPAGE
jgi:hypothetical protein